jgi:hypothetical protein
MALPVILFVSGTCFIKTTQLYGTGLLLLLRLKVGSLAENTGKSRVTDGNDSPRRTPPADLLRSAAQIKTLGASQSYAENAEIFLDTDLPREI